MYWNLYVCLECILGFQVLKLVWVYWIRRPVSVQGPQVSITLKCLQDSDIAVGLPTIFGKWFTSVLCLLQGPEIMVKAYRKVGKTESYECSTLNV